MNEEEYQSGFVRRTSDPTHAKHLKKPSRLKMTGDTLTSFLANRKSGNLDIAFEKYNREYNELRRIAIEVNEVKSEADSKGEFTDVKDKLDEYNAQVKRLAESAVKILLFDEDIQKIKFKVDKDVEKSMARALKVPSFLIGPLKYLSSAGRAYMKGIKEAKEQAHEQLEQEIADVVAKNAREVVGLNPNGDNIEAAAQKTMGEDEAAKLQSLSNIGEIKESVISELTAPTADIPQPDVASVPEEQVSTPIVEEPNADKERNTQVDAGVANKKMQRQQQLEPSEAMFARLSGMVRGFGVDLLTNSDKSKQRLTLYVKANEEKKYLNPELLAKNMGNADLSDEEKVSLYEKVVDAVLFAQIWQEKASFSNENKDVFKFIYDAVGQGYGEDTLLVKASRELSPEKQQVLKSVVEGNFAFVRRAVETFASNFVDEKTDTDEKENTDVRNAQVDEGIGRRRNKGKVEEEIIPTSTEETPTKEVPAKENDSDNASTQPKSQGEQVPVPQDDEKVVPIPVDEEPQEKQEPVSKEEEKTDDPKTTTFKELNEKIRELVEIKESLQESKRTDDKTREAIAKIDSELEILVQRVSDLLDNNMNMDKSSQLPNVTSESKPDTKKRASVPEKTQPQTTSPKIDDSDEYAKFWGELYGKILDDPDGEKKLSSLEKKGVDFEEVEEKYATGRHRIDVRESGERHDELADEIGEETTKKADSQITKAKKYVVGELLSSLGVVPRGMIDEWDQYDEQKADLGQVLKNVSESKKDEYGLAVEELAGTLAESGVKDANGEEVDFQKAITTLLADNDSKEQRKSAVSILKAVTLGNDQKTM